VSRHHPRILFVGQLPPPANGMTMTTEMLLPNLTVRDGEIVHLDTSDHRTIANVGRLDLINVLLAAKHGLAFLALLLAKRPDVIYLPLARNRLGFLRDWLFLLPARLARRPTILHFHSNSFMEFYENESWWMRALIRVAFGPRTHAIVLAESLRDAFHPLISEERVHVIPNGVPDVGAGRAAGEREQIVLHLTTLWSEKGVFDVLAVASELKRVIPEARFLLAGPWYSEKERRQAQEWVERQGLGETVTFLGPVKGKRKAKLLQDAAVLLFPTRYRFECQPLIVLEALSAGTPVITTPLEVLRDTIGDGREGYLVKPGDISGLSSRTVAVLQDPVLRQRLSTSARARYERDYRFGRFAASIDALLTDLMPTAPRAADDRDTTLKAAGE
jgi:glycosyltransferase involved in cell wall biosynthesis